jgi:NADPH-dependent 2,4-dienoyl-CoA reductase/sulfur reductase-like enzyme
VVQIARELLVDPDFVNKVRTGREDDAHRCLRCETCFSTAFSNRYHRCAINPKLGTYTDSKFEIPPARKQTVLVVGGGVAGMQAALTACERGHEVILCEKSDRLGGVLNCERSVPFKDKLTAYLDRQARKVGRANIDVRLHTEVTPAYAEELRPGALVIAAGAVPVIPPVPGIDRPNVKGAAAIYADPELAGKKVVIIGGGLVGLELAIHLGDMGRDVAVIEMLDEISDSGNTIHAIAVHSQLERLHIPVALSTKAVEINETGLVSEGREGRKLYPADTVIYASGQRPLWETVQALKFCAPEIHIIGDCRAPRVIAEATREAYYAARDIGAF